MLAQGRESPVTVIGAGITGSTAACLLHDRGLEVRLVDPHGEPMQGASRWNEGKLHLGYTYTGTDSLDTARLMLAGTASFETILRAVCGQVFDEAWWSRPVIYLVDPDSIFDVDELWRRTNSVAGLQREVAARSQGLQRFSEPALHRLDVQEAGLLTGQRRIRAAWRTGERSISPSAVADILARAVQRRGIRVMRARITAIAASDGGWKLACEDGGVIRSHAVLNCAWESRALLDRPLEKSSARVNIRYKAGLFGRDQPGWEGVHASTRILGAFGDVTPYGDRNVYLSWYPAGLLAQSQDGVPPPVPEPRDSAAVCAAILKGLGLDFRLAGSWTLRGGYVVAQGEGDIRDRLSTLHHRHRPDAFPLAPRYVSVDTGKYCLGPLLAQRAVDMLLSRWNNC